MTTPQELRTQRQVIPDGATADDVASIVRAILSLPVTVKTITISDDSSEGRGEIVWEAYYPKVEPPDGELPHPPPEDLYEMLSQIKIEDVGRVKSTKLDMKALRIVAGLLMMAGRRRRAGIGWMVGDAARFMVWLGVKTSNVPTRFLGIPIIERSSIPKDRLVLLLGLSFTSDPLDADSAISIVMEVKNEASD
jgi:hypothetical protein